MVTENECWREHRLQASERPKVMYEYVVTGWGSFPYDMLRYDAAWPATTDDASKIERYTLGDGKHRSIKLYSYKPPTIERWSSFVWSVGFAAARAVGG